MEKKVLILCTGNSCRSQMAQVLWSVKGQGKWVGYSAGSRPAGYVHPLAIAALQEKGLPTDGLVSKAIQDVPVDSMDLVVTVCDNAQQDCPLPPDAVRTLHWPFDDPADATGSDEEIMECFRRVRDEIEEKISSFLAHDDDDAGGKP